MQTITFFLLLIFGSIIVALPNKWSLRFLFAYVGFEGFAKVISNYHPVVHVGSDLLVVTLVAKTIVLLVLGKIRSTESVPPLTVLFGLHFLWFLISFANPYSLGIIPSIAASKVYVTMFMLYFFGYYTVKNDPKEAKAIMLIWVSVTAVHSLASIYQSLEGPSSVTNIHPRYAVIWSKYADTAFRPFGLTHLPGLPSIFVFLSMPFLLFFFFQTRSVVVKILCFVQIPLWVVTSFLCQVRSALLKTIISGVFFVFVATIMNSRRMTQRKVFNAIERVLATLALAYTMPSILEGSTSLFPDAEQAFERTLTLFDVDKVSEARGGTTERILKYSSMFPFGAGLSRTGPAGGRFYHLISSPEDPIGDIFFTDNFWITTLIDLGIPGTLILSLLVGLILFRSARSIKLIPDAEERMIHLAVFAGVLGSCFGMYGAEAILYNPEACYFWFFAGSLIALQERAKLVKFQKPVPIKPPQPTEQDIWQIPS